MTKDVRLSSIRRRLISAAKGSRDLIYNTDRHNQIAGLCLLPLRALKRRNDP